MELQARHKPIDRYFPSTQLVHVSGDPKQVWQVASHTWHEKSDISAFGRLHEVQCFGVSEQFKQFESQVMQVFVLVNISEIGQLVHTLGSSLQVRQLVEHVMHVFIDVSVFSGAQAVQNTDDPEQSMQLALHAKHFPDDK